MAGRDDLQPRQALLDHPARIGMVVLRRWFKKYNHAENAARAGRLWSDPRAALALFEHDLFGKPVSTFPDHAPTFSA
jgi:hypothetical protein